MAIILTDLSEKNECVSYGQNQCVDFHEQYISILDVTKYEGMFMTIKIELPKVILILTYIHTIVTMIILILID